MKTQTLSFLTCMALLLSFISCTSNVQELETEQLQLLKQIVMTTEDFEPEADSRTLYQIAEGAVKCSWASNDTVGVFPDKGMQTCFPMTSENGMKNATFDGGGWALKDGSTYGAYYPFIGNMYLDKKSIPVSYKKQTQVGNGSIAHLGTYDYMVATPVAPEFGSAHFTFKHLGVLVQLRLTIPQAATLTSMKLVTEIKAFALEGKVNIMADAPSISPIFSENEIELTLQDISTTEENQVVTLYMVLPPANLSEQTLKAVVVSNKGTLEYVLENKNFQAGKAYALTGTIKEAPIGNGTYQNGVVSIAEAGTMKKLLGDDYLNITSLKVVGPINGDDVYYLRKMLGGSNFSEADWGKLTTLDLSEATIVEGGEYYYQNLGNLYTSNNVIGDYMFFRCYNLQNIMLPNNLVSIGKYAFSECNALIKTEIPDSVISMGECTFSGCKGLTSVIIGNGVDSIEYRTFDSCLDLESITIGIGVTSIDHTAFSNCSSLSSLYISDISSWCNIDIDYAFEMFNEYKLYLKNKEVTKLIIPEGVTEIKKYVFSNCKSITEIIMSKSVNTIGESAFRGCDALTSLIIGENVTTIDNAAFSDCRSLSSINIPDNVISIGSLAFEGCIALTSATIGNGVTTIEGSAFGNCSALTSVSIGKSVKTIKSGAFAGTSISKFYSYATEPPGTPRYSEPFGKKISDAAILYVPARCGAAYKSSYWTDYFKNIIEMD